MSEWTDLLDRCRLRLTIEKDQEDADLYVLVDADGRGKEVFKRGDIDDVRTFVSQYAALHGIPEGETDPEAGK